MKRLIPFIALAGMAHGSLAQGVNITSWIFNTTGNTYNGILTDVEAVHYTNTNIYITSSGIPYYYQDGLTVNDGADANWVINIPRNPVENTGTKSMVGQGQIGIHTDGSVFFHPGDARSYQNAGKWNQLAYFFEGQDFDPSNGHSTPTNTYHHHVINLALSSDHDSSKHSPLVGFAWDGFPLYGPFGYADPLDATSDITRMKTGYQKRNITQRTTLPDGTSATGPAIGGQYPLGCYVEDYEYVAGSGTLDQYNGRYCKTPEYPNGTYAYFKTIDANLKPEYPYFIGTHYYGVVQQGNMGPNGGKNTIPSTATKYVPPTSIKETEAAIQLKLYPNPVSNQLYIELEHTATYDVAVVDMNGREVIKTTLSGNVLNMEQLASGMYMITLKETQTGAVTISKFVKE